MDDAIASGTKTGNPGVLKLKTGFLSRPWTRLDSYIFSEITQPFLGALLVYNGMFFLQVIAEIADLSGSNFNIPFRLYVLFFLSQVPEILSITVAMSFLFAALTAVGRMSVDSEIIAPQSLGISFWRMSRPIIAYGLLLTLSLSVVNHWVGPWLNGKKAEVLSSFARNFKMPNLQQGVINTFGADTALYVKGVEQGRLAEILMVFKNDGHESVIMADRASIYTNRELRLFDAVFIQFFPDQIRTTKAETLNRVIPVVKKFNEERIRGQDHDRQDSVSLLANLPTDPQLRNQAKLVLWERFWSPFVCLIFALYAVPLAAKHSRMRKSAGFGLSLLIIGMYFLFSKVSRDLVSEGKVSHLIALSAPPLIFFILGLLLQIGKGTWWSQRIQHFQDQVGYTIRYGFSRFFGLFRKQPKQQQTVLAAKPARTFIFPSKLDAYLTRTFFSIFIMVQLSLLMLLLLIEYTQVSKAARRNNISGETLLQYLLYKIPEMLDMSMFICLLIATLIMLSVMSKNHEITAIRAAGGSLQRLCLPIIVIGFFATIFSHYMSNSFVPKTNRQAITLKNIIKNRNNDASFSRNQWLKSTDDELVNFKYFDQATKSLVGVRKYTLIKGEEALIKWVSVPKLVFDGGWRADSTGLAWTISYPTDPENPLQGKLEKIEKGSGLNLSLDLDDLSQQRRRASEFSIAELQQYLAYIRSMGAAGTDFQTELYVKYARPFMPLIMILLAMPLGFHFGRRGSFYGVALGLIAGMVFWGLVEFTKTLGSNGMVHPVVAGSSVVITVGFIALYRFINLKE